MCHPPRARRLAAPSRYTLSLHALATPSCYSLPLPKRCPPTHLLASGLLAVLREDGDSEHSAILLPAVSRTGRSYVEFLIENTGKMWPSKCVSVSVSVSVFVDKYVESKNPSLS
jgi:hypothetical protein